MADLARTRHDLRADRPSRPGYREGSEARQDCASDCRGCEAPEIQPRGENGPVALAAPPSAPHGRGGAADLARADSLRLGQAGPAPSRASRAPASLSLDPGGNRGGSWA